MALVGIELETLVSEPDALTTRPPHGYDASSFLPVNTNVHKIPAVFPIIFSYM